MLKETLIESTHFFAKEVLDTEVELYESCSLLPGYAANITIEGDENLTISIHILPKSLKKMAYLFLFEENPDEEILQDLICEITNLIVGRAKVYAAERHKLHFNISTPNYLGQDVIIKQNDFEINFTFEDEVFSIIGKLD